MEARPSGVYPVDATTTPAVVPMRNPPTASISVFFADSNSGNRSPFQFSTSAAMRVPSVSSQPRSSGPEAAMTRALLTRRDAIRKCPSIHEPTDEAKL